MAPAAAAPEPDPAAIRAHLALLFGPCAELYPQGLIELRHGPRFHSSYFGCAPRALDQAAEFAASRARAGANVYVGVNPRRPLTDLRRGASAADIELAFFHFADLDDAGAVSAAGARLRRLPPSFTVTTGTAPHRRPHFYWALEEPVRNLAAWTALQRGIAEALGGDSVIDPPRIMRLAGTVNWPGEDKRRRGYQAELVTLKTAFAGERAPVTSEEVAAAYPTRREAAGAAAGTAVDTGAPLPSRGTLAELLAACRSGEGWHNAMIRLVAHLAARGRSTTEILALAEHITLPGYAAEQTRREIAAALDGARAKWALAEPPDDPPDEPEDEREIFPLLDLDQLESLPPPEWLVHELVVSDGLTVLYGDPGAGKSFVALDLSLRLALGMDWHGIAARQAGVLYIAGEGARGIGKRVKGWRRAHGREDAAAPFLVLPVPVALLEPAQRARLLRTIDSAAARCGFAIGLVVIDTVSRALAGAGENGADEMGAFVAVCDAVRQHSGGAVLGVHHSGKDRDKGMRGSTVLLGACDATIRIEKSDHLVTLKTEKQKDAEQAAPIHLELKPVRWAADGAEGAEGRAEEQSTLVPCRAQVRRDGAPGLSRPQILKVFGIIADAWGRGQPLSNIPQTRAQGRYAPRVLARAVDCREPLMAGYVTGWLETGCLEHDVCDAKTKTRGLRVRHLPGVMR